MEVVYSRHEVDTDKFRAFAQNTARYFVQCCQLHNMAQLYIRFFIHGLEIISHALLPIGQLPEETQEARNKDFKKY